MGGIGRFYLTNHLLNIKQFRYVVFIDDDQMFNSSMIYRFRTVAEEFHSFNWYGRKFRKGKPYVYLDSDGNKVDSYDNKIKVDINEELDYGGTGGMIIDTRIFSNMNFFYEMPKEYLFIEDLWMSFYAKTKYDYRIVKMDQTIHTMRDNKDQCQQLWDVKNYLLEYCRDQGWDV